MLPTIRLFVIGDSISIQYGPYLEEYLPARFLYDRKRDSGTDQAAANLDVPVGANGGDSRMVLAYLQNRRASSPIQADVLLLNCGLHDIKTDPASGARQVAPEAYEANLHAIREEARRSGWRLIWVRTTPVIDEVHNQPHVSFRRHAADVALYNGIADRVMAEAGVPTIDLHAFSEKFLPKGFCDHVHYTETVRALQGAFIAGWLDGLNP